MNSSKSALLVAGVLMVAAFAGIIVIEGADAEEGAPVQYSVTYDVDGKLFTVPAKSNTITLKTLAELGAKSPDNMTFKAWTIGDKTYNAGSTFIIESSDGKATFKASFEDTVYTATFKAADGTVLTSITGTVPDAKMLSRLAPSAPAIEGKIFAGWLADGADKALMNKDLGKLDSDVTYTATYVIDYKITFIDGDKTYQSKISTLVVPDVGTRTGFTFLGWFTADGVQVLDPTAYAYTADTTLTAKWEPVNCYVTFVAGEGYSVKVAVLYGETVVVPELPAGFIAWDFDFATPITEDITVSAVAAAPAKATGLSDPVTMTIVIIVGALALAGVAGFVVLIRKGKIVIGRGPKAVKTEEEKKE